MATCLGQLQFKVQASPAGKARARTFRRRDAPSEVVVAKLRSSGLKVPVYQTVTPTETKRYEKIVAMQARIAVASWRNQHGRDWPTDAIYVLDLKIATDHILVTVEAYPPVEAATGFDLDNVLKAVADGMNKIVYRDDARIGCLYVVDAAREKALNE